MANLYMVTNGTPSAVPGTSPVKITTGAATLKTQMQLAPSVPIKVVEWGFSCDGSAAATPGEVELLSTGTIPATSLTTYVNADIMLFGDPNGPANGAVANVPLTLGTSASGFNTSGGAEGTITATREFDLQLIAPTSQYVKFYPLGREPQIKAGEFLRIRAFFGAAVNVYCYVVFEV